MIIKTDGSIDLDGRPSGLRVTQRREGTIVFSAGHGGTNYREYKMPSARYSLAHDAPRPMHATAALAAKYPPPAGRRQFEADLRALLEALA